MTGVDLHQFVTDQQTIEREERQKERELKTEEQETAERARRKKAEEVETARKEKAEEAEREMIAAVRARQHTLEIKRLELETARIKDTPIRVDHTSAAKLPKIAPLQDGKDELDSYLLRFERFAKANRWEDEQWAGALSALLPGKALDVYSRLSKEAAVKYRQLKEALLKRYDLMEDGYRLKFRKSRPEPAEKPDQFIHRLKNYLKKWIMFSKCDPSQSRRSQTCS